MNFHKLLPVWRWLPRPQIKITIKERSWIITPPPPLTLAGFYCLNFKVFKSRDACDYDFHLLFNKLLAIGYEDQAKHQLLRLDRVQKMQLSYEDLIAEMPKR